MRKIIFLSIFFLNISFVHSYSNNDLYEKIDLFGEVLNKIIEVILFILMLSLWEWALTTFFQDHKILFFLD